MKKLNLISYVLVVCVLVMGCNDLLEDPSPATSLPGEEVLTTENGVEGLRASLYNGLRQSGAYTTQYFVGPSAIADETRNRPGSSRYVGYTEITDNDGGTNGLSSYGASYNIILDANLMISAVEDGVLEEQSRLDRFRGEAYAMRAMTMHNLVRALGYEPGQEVDGWDLGIVIRTEPTLDISDVEARPRATIYEVYDQILNDLEEAKSLLAGQTDNEYITEAYVDGLTARVNLYAGNWSAADAAATEAISNFSGSLSDTEAGVSDMFDETAGGHPEALFKLVVNPNTEPIAGSNGNNGPAGHTADQWLAQLPTNYVIDLYDEDDYRLGWYAPCYNDEEDAPGLDCEAVNDEGFEIQKYNGEKGNMADDLPYMRIAEMYLIQAEARAKANNSVADGVGPLNNLRQTRGLDPVSDADFADLQTFEDEILDERVRELAVEGHRFFDLKRLGRDIPHPDGSTKIRYDSHRMLDDIGAGNISSNPELEENPGY